METNLDNWRVFDWPDSPLFDKRYKIGTSDVPGDGSCYFHSVIKARSLNYRNKSRKEKQLMIRHWRHDLSLLLSKRMDFLSKENSSQIGDGTYYDFLSNGQLASFAKDYKPSGLREMQNELNSSSPVDNTYNEYISNLLNINIFMIDYVKRDLYVIGDDIDLLIKPDRLSICLLVIPGHYQLVGIQYPDSFGVITQFSFTHPFIVKLLLRWRELVSRGSEGKAIYSDNIV